MAKRKVKKTPDYLTTEEIDRLLKVIDNRRDKAMFTLAYHRGLRASELGKLSLGDYQASTGRLYVRRLKGSRSGEYHLTEIERSALKAWLRIRGTAPGPLFPSRKHNPISGRQIWELMKKYCRAAGIPPEKSHPHALKHSCGTHLSAMQPDIVAIQDHMGHANIQNTMVYVAISSKRRDDFGEQLERQGFGQRSPRAA